MDGGFSIVHLSDLHLRITNGQPSIAPDATQALAAAIRAHATTREVLVALTGDVAWSGKIDEYEHARAVLRALLDELARDFTRIEVALLPGNHDVDLASDPLRDLALQGIRQNPPPSLQVLRALCQSQTPFFDFVADIQGNAAGWDSRTVARRSLALGGGNIQITALNTACCSALHESPGSLFLDVDALPDRGEGADCHVVLMHHPLHWLHESVRKICADWIGRTAEVVLMGHEHQFDQMQLHRRNLPGTQYLAGQALDDATAASQGFQILNVNLGTRECVIQTLVRNEDGYAPGEAYNRHLASTSERTRALRPAEAHLRQLESLNVGVTHKTNRDVTHSSIFVYPDLQIQQDRGSSQKLEASRFLDGSLLAERILLEQRMLIVGEEYAGKTFLFRQLYKDLLSKGLYPLMLSARGLRTATIEELVTRSVGEQYAPGERAAYFAVPKADRVLLVEDLDLLPDAHNGITSLVEYAGEWFGASAFSCRELMFLRDPLTGEGSEELWRLPTATISTFSHRKRSQLVSRWVAHEGVGPQESHAREVLLEHRVNELLSQRAVPALPMALTLLLESMDSRDSVDESTGAFGYHYQRLILQALTKEQERRARAGEDTVTDDIALELLGRVAYKVFASGSAEIDADQVQATAVEMREELIISFSVGAAVKTLEGSGLLKRSSQGDYGFPFKYVYQYSVAKLLALWLNNDATTQEVRRIVAGLISTMHSSESASILIFFTFLTRDSETIRNVAEQARQTFSDVAPCDFGRSLDKFFADAPRPLVAPGLDVRGNRNALNATLDQAEVRRIQQEALKEMRQESREAMQSIDRAFQCMQVLGQVLRAYPTRLSGEEKKLVAGECYQLGLRTLAKFIEAIDSAQQLVKDYFRRITVGQVEAHDMVTMELELKRHLSIFVHMGSLAIVKRIARAVGSTHLRPLYPLVQVPNGERPVKIINRAIGLGLLGELRPAETAKLYEDLKKEKSEVAASVLQMLVWEYMFLHPVVGDDRASVLQRMDMKEHPAMLGTRFKDRESLPARTSKRPPVKKRKRKQK